MIKNADSLSLETRGEVLHSAMPKQDKKNATTCIFEPPLRADYSRETRGCMSFVSGLFNLDFEIIEKLFEFILCGEAGVAQISALVFPLVQAAIVEHFQFFVNDERYDVVM